MVKRVKRNTFHSWMSFHSIFAPLVPALIEVMRRRIKRRRARLAQNWPVADGQVQSINVATGTKFFGSPRQFNASFDYSYTVQEEGEVNYFSGDFSRAFPDKERAQEWLELLKNKRIRVHYKPMHPEVSVVLASDLDAHFSVPARDPDDFVLSPVGTRPE